MPSSNARGRFAPQTGKPEYSWEFLQKRPYGSAIWEIVLRQADNKKIVIFAAREAKADILQFPDRAPVQWKAVMLGWDVTSGRRVAPVVILFYFMPLQTIYEIWFNFYGEGTEVQEAIDMLSKQDSLYIMFHDKGPEPIRTLAFPNELASFLHGYYGMLKAMPWWSDDDFNEAKRRSMERYTIEDIWGLK